MEIYNPSASSVDISSYVLYDDKGASDKKAYVFPASTVLAPSAYLLICCNQDDASTGALFKIGGEDVISIADASLNVVDTSGTIPAGAFLDLTFARDADDSDKFKFTTTPTPGKANAIKIYDSAAHLARLSDQNDLGIDFFGMKVDGTKPTSAMGDVVDLEITMEADKEKTMWEEQSFEMYHSVKTFKVGDEELSSGGRMRPRGQSTLAIATCFDIKTIPFLLDFTSKDNTQTLFGVEKMYLRHHMSDLSYSREWTMHRLLARSGLPHLRTRAVRLYINTEYIGLYEAMEAPDQEYVFARSFPNYNKDDFALFKWKTHTTGCGLPEAGYGSKDVEKANEVPPYTFERGSHRDKITVKRAANGQVDLWACVIQFYENMGKEKVGILSAYKAYEGDCAEMLVEEGILDQDLGSDNWKAIMKVRMQPSGYGNLLSFAIRSSRRFALLRRRFTTSTPPQTFIATILSAPRAL